MIADVTKQLVCTAYYNLHKEVALSNYGVDCKKDLWKPYLSKYLLRGLAASTCDKAYDLDCFTSILPSNLVTELVCGKASSFAAINCGVVVSEIPQAVFTCNSAVIIEL